jgi:hypothetical protein
VIFFIGLIYCYFLYLSGAFWRFDSRIREGDVIIVQVEEFKRIYGRLPENLAEIGLRDSEQGPIYYVRSRDGQNYIVSFAGNTLGESVSYRSELAEWRDY